MLLQKLDYLRKRDHWTAEEISRMANIPLGTLNKILTGITKNPALRTMGPPGACVPCAAALFIG